MGVDIRVRGRMVELRGFGSVAGREALQWAEVVRETAASCHSRVFILCEFERGLKIPTADFAGACRASLSLQSITGGLALVTPHGFERTLARVAIAVTIPPYEVGYFEDAWRARDWLTKLATESTAA
jgi:hypothetical protein